MQTTICLAFLISISLVYGETIERLQQQIETLTNQNEILQNQFNELQHQLSSLDERTVSQTACFEDMTDANCTGSKSGMVGIVEAIRVDGDWSLYSQWSECLTTCGGGTQVRNRTCNNPPSAYGGKPCLGENIEKMACNLQACCPDGWTPFDNHCYRFVNKSMTWTQARDFCTNTFEANLTSIRTQEELEFLSNIQDPRITKFNWIGLNKDMWVMSDGSALGSSVWIEGHPDSWPLRDIGSYTLTNTTNDGILWERLFICEMPFIGNPSTDDLISRDSFLDIMRFDYMYPIFGETSFRGPAGSDGNPRWDTFEDAKAIQREGTGIGNIEKVLMMEPGPGNSNDRFPLIEVAIQQRVHNNNQYEILDYPPNVGARPTQTMVYLPAWADSIVCTELPNKYTRHLLPWTVPTDLVLTDGLSGCSVFTIRFDPKPKNVEKKFRYEYFCHMNALNAQNNDPYSNKIIERSIMAANLLSPYENQNNYKNPRVIRKVEGQGHDYTNEDLVLVAAYNNNIDNENEQWRLRYQITRNGQKIEVDDK